MTAEQESQVQSSPIDVVIRAFVESVLAECDGSPNLAYVRLGIGRTTLYRWLKRWKKEDRIAKREAKRETDATGGMLP